VPHRNHPPSQQQSATHPLDIEQKRQPSEAALKVSILKHANIAANRPELLEAVCERYRQKLVARNVEALEVKAAVAAFEKRFSIEYALTLGAAMEKFKTAMIDDPRVFTDARLIVTYKRVKAFEQALNMQSAETPAHLTIELEVLEEVENEIVRRWRNMRSYGFVALAEKDYESNFLPAAAPLKTEAQRLLSGAASFEEVHKELIPVIEHLSKIRSPSVPSLPPTTIPVFNGPPKSPPSRRSKSPTLPSSSSSSSPPSSLWSRLVSWMFKQKQQ